MDLLSAAPCSMMALATPSSMEPRPELWIAAEPKRLACSRGTHISDWRSFECFGDKVEERCRLEGELPPTGPHGVQV